jgi:hypothetical protein
VLLIPAVAQHLLHLLTSGRFGIFRDEYYYLAGLIAVGFIVPYLLWNATHTTALPQHFSDRLGWENLARVVSETYRGLPADQRGACVAIGSNYGHAAALEYWSRCYPLPPVYSTHNDYWLWGPPRSAAVSVLVGGRREEMERLFAEVHEAGAADSPHAQESHLTTWICRGLRQPIEDVWRDNKSFIY